VSAKDALQVSNPLLHRKQKKKNSLTSVAISAALNNRYLALCLLISIGKLEDTNQQLQTPKTCDGKYWQSVT
jgi:hypothetical protein